MADTTFVNGTVVQPAWLNDANDWTYQGKDISGIHIINVKDPTYGATGDGTTDDYAAIAAAITALPASGGQLIFPNGTYLFSTTIVINKPVTIVGTGTSNLSGTAGGVVLKKAATLAGKGIQITGNAVKLQNLILQGVAGNTGDGISIEANRCTLEDVCVYAAGGDGVRIGTDAGVNANLWTIRNLRSKSNGGHGLHLSDKTSPTLADANGGSLFHADLQSNGDAGCRITNAQLNTFVGLVCQSNTGRGLSLGAGADYNTFVGGDFESNTADEINVEAGATSNKFLGGAVTGSITDNGTGTIFLGLAGTVFEQGLKVSNVASSNATTLDWYEEGSWTPVLTFATPGDLAVTYSAQVGRYQRIGNRVTASYTITTSAFTHTTASGALHITGLPFAAQATANIYGTGELEYSGITAATTPAIIGRVDPSASLVGFFGSGSGVANVNITTTQVPTGGNVVLVGTVSYQV